MFITALIKTAPDTLRLSTNVFFIVINQIVPVIHLRNINALTIAVKVIAQGIVLLIIDANRQ